MHQECDCLGCKLHKAADTWRMAVFGRGHVSRRLLNEAADELDTFRHALTTIAGQSDEAMAEPKSGTWAKKVADAALDPKL